MIKIFDMVPGWLWCCACGVLLVGLGLTSHRLDAERLAHQTTLTQQAEQRAQAEARAREAESTHAQTIEAITQKAAHDRKTLAADVARLTRSLRDRPERPAGLPESATSAVACTGAGLYRADGEFLAGEAARANETRLQLADCKARYDAAVELTKKPAP